MRILLVEDEPDNLEALKTLLELDGYQVVTATNGVEGYHEFLNNRPDLVITDANMPEMDGFEASRQITTRWPVGKRPRIVAMTANAMQGDRELCLAAGMDDYVSKPIRVDELVAALMDV